MPKPVRIAGYPTAQFFGWLSLGAVVLAIAFWGQASATPAQAPAILSFTAAQADRGQDEYEDNCADCHGASLAGEAEAPPLRTAAAFRSQLFGDAPIVFFSYISNAMPQGDPGGLDAETYAEIMAYVLQRNGFAAGDTELPADLEALAALTYPE